MPCRGNSLLHINNSGGFQLQGHAAGQSVGQSSALAHERASYQGVLRGMCDIIAGGWNPLVEYIAGPSSSYSRSRVPLVCVALCSGMAMPSCLARTTQ
jgi:hypothetical protein